MKHPITYTKPATYAGIKWREAILMLPNVPGYLCPRLHLRQSRKGSTTWDVVHSWIDGRGRSHDDTLEFELKDKITHIFSTGFPKGLDISKAIDAELGATREVVGKHLNPCTTGPRLAMGEGWQLSPDITAPATPEAQQWDGYKTALKPAAEEWILIRKPISERNVARNVLTHGTGGLNIDACRVGTNSKKWASPRGGIWSTDANAKADLIDTNQGRYPPHVVFSHAPDCTDAACVEGCPVRELGEQSGVSVSKASQRGSVKVFSDKVRGSTGWEGKSTERGHDDTGTAARFFPVFRYQAKPAPSERAGSTHPTQKSLALMEWLVKLVTAPDQTVLDCFMGSGTTGVAALRVERQFVGIEMDAAYFAIAEQRITEEQNRPKQLDMFGEE
jgi:site-specific DNA-methyltransferase (adenine-specific)